MSTEEKQTKDAVERGSLETTFSEIEAIIADLESKDMSLDDTFSLYEQGMKKLKHCNDEIDQVEKKMLKINEQGELEEF